MAVSTGTATGYVDLLDKFRQFITGSAMGTQAWAQVGWDLQADGVGRNLYLRGPGTSGADQIFVQLRTSTIPAGDIFNIQINASTGFNAQATPKYEGQPGYDGGVLNLLLWNQAIPYWFIANGRRFIIVAKVSTTYQSAYGGFILPYGLPSEYPYPLAIGAMFSGQARWSNTTAGHLSFTSPCSTLRLRMPSGNWLPFANYRDNGVGEPIPMYNQNVWPTIALPNVVQSPDGTYTLNNLTLHSDLVNSGAARGVFGELQGVARISGFGNASENTQVVDGVTWLVVQDGFRTGLGNYFAVALE